MNIINIIIPGKPTGKARSRKRKYGQWYNPQQDFIIQIENIIKNQLPESFKAAQKKVPVKISFTFLFNPVKSEKKIKEFQEYLKKPDLDNLEKMYADILSKIVYHDDNQIYSSNAEKRYTLNNPRTEIEIIW